MKEIINIPETEKRYKDEWLLFEVIETDRLNQPIRGRLLYHSKDRNEIHKVAMKSKCKIDYITFTGDPFPKDGAVILL